MLGQDKTFLDSVGSIPQGHLILIHSVKTGPHGGQTRNRLKALMGLPLFNLFGLKKGRGYYSIGFRDVRHREEIKKTLKGIDAQGEIKMTFIELSVDQYKNQVEFYVR